MVRSACQDTRWRLLILFAIMTLSTGWPTKGIWAPPVALTDRGATPVQAGAFASCHDRRLFPPKSVHPSLLSLKKLRIAHSSDPQVFAHSPLIP